MSTEGAIESSIAEASADPAELTPGEPQAIATALNLSVSLLSHSLSRIPVERELTVPQMAALSRLQRAAVASPGELAKAARLTPQGMGSTLAVLESLGYVERRSDPSDGRRVLMSVTEVGSRKLHDAQRGRTQKIALALIDGFSTAELETLHNAASLIERLSQLV